MPATDSETGANFLKLILSFKDTEWSLSYLHMTEAV